MSTLYIAEYVESDNQSGTHGFDPQEPAIAVQAITFTGTAGVSAAFNALTGRIRITADAICSYRFGVTPSAVTTDPRLALGAEQLRRVQPGSGLKVSAIANT